MLSNARALGYMRLLSIWKADNVIEKLHFFILFYSNEGKCICQHRVGSYCIGLPTLTARWRIQTVQELGVLQHSVTRMKVAWLYPTLCDPMDCIVHGIPQARILEGVGSHSLLQGIFPTQGSNPGLPHCRRILYQLSHQGTLCRVVNLCVTYSWLSVSEVPPCTQFCINGSNHDSRFNHDWEVLVMYSPLEKKLHVSGLLHSTPCCSRVKCNYKRTRGEAGRFIRKLIQWSRGEVMIDRWR